MIMQPVASSWIESIGHDPSSSTLRIKTRRGEVYDYHGVDAQKHAQLLKSRSIGKQFALEIKHHPFRKIA